MATSPAGMPVLTQSEAAEAQKRFEQMCADFEQKRAARGGKPGPEDHWTYRELYAAAFGAPAVQIIADPK